MKHLIVYTSRYGSTERCALALGDRIQGGAQIVDLRATRRGGAPAEERLRAAEVVVIGGPIYAGRIRPEISRFCERNREALLARRVALFICGLETGDRAREELAAAFPEWLSAHAFSRRILGGEARLGSMRWLDRFLFTRVARGTGDIYRIDTGEIGALAAEINALQG
jgi:menaquinone-dependent protoporphyrinogen oxidase